VLILITWISFISRSGSVFFSIEDQAQQETAVTKKEIELLREREKVS
jgi:hypothetical protein